jgi:hypothetical protein
MRGPPNSLPRCFLICKGRMGLARGKGSLIRAGPSYPQRPEVPWLLTCATQPRTVSGFVDHHYLFVFSLFLERLRSHGHEENLSTEQTAPQAQPWVPSPHGYSRGTGRAEASPREGPRALDALIFSATAHWFRTRQDFRRKNACAPRTITAACSPIPSGPPIGSSLCSRAATSWARLG